MNIMKTITSRKSLQKGVQEGKNDADPFVGFRSTGVQSLGSDPSGINFESHGGLAQHKQIDTIFSRNGVDIILRKYLRNIRPCNSDYLGKPVHMPKYRGPAPIGRQ